jgi:hypothetical protein
MYSICRYQPLCRVRAELKTAAPQKLARYFGVASKGARAGPYGLKMVDYSVPPPTWPLPIPPPARKGAVGRTQTYLGPVLAAAFALAATYVYFNQEEDIYEYWKQVERGYVRIDGEEEDDEEDDDESEWDEEE